MLTQLMTPDRTRKIDSAEDQMLGSNKTLIGSDGASSAVLQMSYADTLQTSKNISHIMNNSLAN